MIARTKTRYLGSRNMLMWGYLVVITTISVWVLVTSTHNPVWNWLWFAIPLIGFPTTSIMAHKHQRHRGATSYSDKITSRLWTIFGISQIVLIILCIVFSLLGEIVCWGAMLVYPILLASGEEIPKALSLGRTALYWARYSV